MMWECSYAREPMDFKLFWIRFFRKIWIFLAGILAGILFIGGGYFLKKVVFAPEKQYRVVGEIYIEYQEKENATIEAVCFNQVTWASLVKTEEFLTDMQKQLRAAGTDMTQQQLADSISATLLSDVRIVTTTVVTGDPALSVKISEALQNAILHFGERQKEITATRIMTAPDEAELVMLDIRTLRAVLLGAVVGGFVTLAAMLLYFTLDDSIYIPAAFERRYKIPMLGTPASKELSVNFERFCGGLKKVAVTAVSESVPIKEAETFLTCVSEKTATAEQEAAAITGYSCVEEAPEHAAALRAADGIVLVVSAGRHDGKQIEKTISFLDKQGCNICGALLWDADETLLKWYYGCGFSGRKR